MAARRLQSDRFFTVDYTPETYTPVGLRVDRRRRRWATSSAATTRSCTPPENPFTQLLGLRAMRSLIAWRDVFWVTGRPWPGRITRGSSATIRCSERW